MSPAWRDHALERLRPTQQHDDRITRAAASLSAAVEAHLEDQGWEGRPRVEGSVAKGTYLRGHGDTDVFVAFPPELDRKTLVDRTQELAELLDDPVIAYAEHPYAQGTWEGFPAEIVPCYDLDDPTQLRSAVDRTPFHTDYVIDRLTDDHRDEVRLLKAFLVACGCYGAQESVLGFSGYLCELLILAFEDLENTLAWAVRGFPSPIVVEAEATESFEDALVVVDPVDPSRNVAAAVTRRTLERFREAAAAFRAAPDASFFEAPEPARLNRGRAEDACQSRGTRVLAWSLPVDPGELEDPLFAQARRATRFAVDALERDQVPVAGAAVLLEAGEDGTPVRAWGMVEAEDGALDQPLIHQGPPANAEDHAERFRQRWTDAPDAASPVVEQEGRLMVHHQREATTLAEIARPLLEKANAGKAIDQGLEKGTLDLMEGPEALDAMPEEARGRLLDRRRPWDR